MNKENGYNSGYTTGYADGLRIGYEQGRADEREKTVKEIAKASEDIQTILLLAQRKFLIDQEQ